MVSEQYNPISEPPLEIAFLYDAIVYLYAICIGKDTVFLHGEIIGDKNVIDATLCFQVGIERIESAV